MEQKTLDEVRDIKKSLRLAMNGVVSTLQRRQGLDYKINFGVEIPRLKGIADAHSKNKELAATLWQDNIRECKMLAIFLMPEDGYHEVADKWIAETKFTEIADQLAMHLLCKLPDAWNKALHWTANDKGMYCYCGFLTISHLIRCGIMPDKKQEQIFFKSVISKDGQDGQGIATRCALNALINYLDRSPGSVATLKELINNEGSGPATITVLLENFEE
jgi:hypothetical protein